MIVQSVVSVGIQSIGPSMFFFSDGLFGLWSVFKIGQSLDWSVDPFVGRLVSRSVGRSINPSLDQSIGLSTNHSFSQPV